MISLKTYVPYYKENLRLAMPVILSQVGQITVQLADTAMVGWYGGDDHAAGCRIVRHKHILHHIHLGHGSGLRPDATCG